MLIGTVLPLMTVSTQPRSGTGHIPAVLPLRGVGGTVTTIAGGPPPYVARDCPNRPRILASNA
jgi:hypothetical protein